MSQWCSQQFVVTPGESTIELKSIGVTAIVNLGPYEVKVGFGPYEVKVGFGDRQENTYWISLQSTEQFNFISNYLGTFKTTAAKGESRIAVYGIKLDSLTTMLDQYKPPLGLVPQTRRIIILPSPGERVLDI